MHRKSQSICVELYFSLLDSWPSSVVNRILRVASCRANRFDSFALDLFFLVEKFEKEEKIRNENVYSKLILNFFFLSRNLKFDLIKEGRKNLE